MKSRDGAPDGNTKVACGDAVSQPAALALYATLRGGSRDPLRAISIPRLTDRYVGAPGEFVHSVVPVSEAM